MCVHTLFVTYKLQQWITTTNSSGPKLHVSKSNVSWEVEVVVKCVQKLHLKRVGHNVGTPIYYQKMFFKRRRQVLPTQRRPSTANQRLACHP